MDTYIHIHTHLEDCGRRGIAATSIVSILVLTLANAMGRGWCMPVEDLVWVCFCVSTRRPGPRRKLGRTW